MKAAILNTAAALAFLSVVGGIAISAYRDGIVDDCTNRGAMTVRGQKFTCAPAGQAEGQK